MSQHEVSLNSGPPAALHTTTLPLVAAWQEKVTLLTGTMGSGKSLLLKMLGDRGAYVLSADALTSEVKVAGSPGYQKIVAAFGSEILNEHGEIDNRRFAALIFSDPALLRAAEKIIHPLVRDLAAQRFSEAIGAGRSPLVYEAPICFEVNMHREGFQSIVTVGVSDEVCISRAIARKPGTTRADVEARIAQQWPVDEKRRLSEFWVDNSGSVADLERQADDLMGRLRHADLIPGLARKWNAAFRELGIDNDRAKPFFNALIRAYSDPARGYHNVQHIAELCELLNEVQEHVQSPARMVAALFYHDAIYDARSVTNEEDSTTLFRRDMTALNMRAEDIEWGAQAILSTKKHRALIGDPDIEILLDLDLSILARDAARYREYTQGIRSEYCHVAEEFYAERRAGVMQGFLECGALFHRPDIFPGAERRAEHNIREEIRELLGRVTE